MQLDKVDRGLFCVLCLFVAVFVLPWWLVIIIFLVCNFSFFKLNIFWIFCLIGLVFLRVFYFDVYELNRLNDFRGEVNNWSVQICAEPDFRLEFVNYTVCVQEEDYVGARLLLKLPLYQKFKYKDNLVVSGIIEDAFESEDFSYKNYLKIYKIEAVLNNPQVKEVQNFEGFSVRRTIYDLKFNLFLVIEKSVVEPYSSLLLGLLFGSRRGFSDEVNEIFSMTGLTHIVAVSGYNVSLVILLIERLLFFIPRQIRFYFLSTAIFIFAILAGLSASVLRACIMGFISVLVIQTGYSNSLLRAMLLTAVLMIFWNPASLYFDLGFQLSFFATLGVVYLAKIFEFKFVTSKFGLRDSLSLTLSAQVATIPTILYYFGNLSLISPLANLLVAPFLPILMLLGFLQIIFAKIYILNWILVLMTSSLAYLFFELVKFLAVIPFASLKLSTQNLGLLIMVYVLIFIWILRFLGRH